MNYEAELKEKSFTQLQATNVNLPFPLELPASILLSDAIAICKPSVEDAEKGKKLKYPVDEQLALMLKDYRNAPEAELDMQGDIIMSFAKYQIQEAEREWRIAECEIKLKEPPEWYTKDEIYDWLIHMNYHKAIAEELSAAWASDLQNSFTKGWEKAKNETRIEQLKSVKELTTKGE